MTPLHGIACFYDVGFGVRAVSRKTPIYFIIFLVLSLFFPFSSFFHRSSMFFIVFRLVSLFFIAFGGPEGPGAGSDVRGPTWQGDLGLVFLVNTNERDAVALALMRNFSLDNLGTYLIPLRTLSVLCIVKTDICHFYAF